VAARSAALPSTASWMRATVAADVGAVGGTGGGCGGLPKIARARAVAMLPS
jgi:hypothetical protein